MGIRPSPLVRHRPPAGLTGSDRRGALLYRKAGWAGVLPLPPTAKFPPPKGFTGYDGAWPTDGQIAQWVSNRPAEANLTLRVNYGIIGIDVDAYGTKTGGRALQNAESSWGQLPPTYRSTARPDDPVSGIRIFKVPEGVLFRDRIAFPDLGVGDIEIVQPHHRFIVGWPSIHPSTGQQYRWFGPDGVQLPEGDVPPVVDLPELPQKWVEWLSRTAVRDEVFDGSAPRPDSSSTGPDQREPVRAVDAGRRHASAGASGRRSFG